MAEHPWRVLIVDDHMAFAEALTLTINMTPDIAVVGTLSDADELAERVRGTRPDLIIIDQHLDGTVRGTDVIEELRSEGLRMATMLLTGYPSPSVLTKAAQLGLVVVDKATQVRDIVTAIRDMRAGRAPECAVDPGQFALLSPGELRVLEHLGQGRRAAEVAEQLSLSVHTVRDHIKAILRKLEVSSQLEAVVEAQRRGIISPPT